MANSVETTLPSRCLLYQALLWVVEQSPPIQDSLFMSLPPPTWIAIKEKNKRDLLIALRGGIIPAEGVFWRPHGNGKPYSKIGETIEISPADWKWENVDWEKSLLREDYWDDVGREKILRPKFVAITVATAALVRAFPPEKKPIELTPDAPAPASQRGRPPKYDWPAFHAEVAVRADFDLLPKTLAELQRDMAEWCSLNWEDVPGEATLREKLSPIYSHPRKARK